MIIRYKDAVSRGMGEISMNRFLGAWPVQSGGLEHHSKGAVPMLGVCHGCVLQFYSRSATCTTCGELAYPFICPHFLVTCKIH